MISCMAMRSLLKYLGPQNGKLASCGILRNTFSVMVKPVAFLKLVACSENPWALHPPFVSVTSPAVCTLDIDVRLHDSGTEITDLWGSPLSVTNTLAVTGLRICFSMAVNPIQLHDNVQEEMSSSKWIFSCKIASRLYSPPPLSFPSRRGCLL